MNIWNILDIAPTPDEKRIKRAYAKLIKTIDQATEAARFQQVREAYDQALAYAKYQQQEQATETADPLAEERQTEVVQLQPLADNASDTASPEHYPPPPAPVPAEPDIVVNDIQALAQLLPQDQPQAGERLQQLLAGERYVSLQNRERFELNLLYMLYQSDEFPDAFAQTAQALFDWNLYDNPFKPNTPPSHVYTAIVREIARQRTIHYVIDNYHPYKPAKWQEAEKIVFAPFDQAKLEQAAADPDLRTALIHIFRFIYQQKFHPEEFPVPYETNEWVLQHVPAVKPPAPTIRHRRWSSRSYRIFIMLAALSLFQVFAYIHNDNNDDYQPPQNPTRKNLQTDSHNTKFKDTNDLPYRLDPKLLKQLTDPQQ